MATVVLSGGLALSGTAHAAGVEDTVAGSVALGRAANYARVNDFMATWQNPANLALAPSNVGAELRLPIFNACFDRAKNNTSEDLDLNGQPGIQYRPDETFQEVCNEAPPFPAGNLGASFKLTDKLGLGVGLFTPAGVGSLKFGSDNNPTWKARAAETLQTSQGTLSPNRYLLVDRQVLAGFLGLGLGYAPTERLRVGLMLASGFADVKYKNFASQSPIAQEEDIVNDVRVRDFFIPRATLSVAATPVDSVDVMGSFSWTDDINAKGYVDVTANGLNGAPLESCRARTTDASGMSKATPGPHCRVNDVQLSVPYPRFEGVLGARYAARDKPRAAVLDPLSEERWDVEIDGYWVNTGHVKDYSLELYDESAPTEKKPFIAFSTAPNFTNATSLPARAALPHRWNDTLGVRAGGDYNVVSGVLAVRAGVAYETRGVPIKNMNIDYWPVQKTTLSVGLTWRIHRVDVSAAYAHTFNETVDVKVGQGNVREVVVMAPDQALVVNEGRYRSQIDTLSLQANYRF